jgi:hypothetical protein
VGAFSAIRIESYANSSMQSWAASLQVCPFSALTSIVSAICWNESSALRWPVAESSSQVLLVGDEEVATALAGGALMLLID